MPKRLSKGAIRTKHGVALGRNYEQRQQRESSYEIRTVGWLELLRADILFGWRQLKRNKVTSAVAILSLALAMGACIGAFRLIDALLWRPLPVAHADRLYAISRVVFTLEGKPFDLTCGPILLSASCAMR